MSRRIIITTKIPHPTEILKGIRFVFDFVLKISHAIQLTKITKKIKIQIIVSDLIKVSIIDKILMNVYVY